jgi:hypothetical protein
VRQPFCDGSGVGFAALYAKHAEVTVPSLADWEKDWQENPQRNIQTKLLQVNFQLPLALLVQSN